MDSRSSNLAILGSNAAVTLTQSRLHDPEPLGGSNEILFLSGSDGGDLETYVYGGSECFLGRKLSNDYKELHNIFASSEVGDSWVSPVRSRPSWQSTPTQEFELRVKLDPWDVPQFH